MPQKPTEGVQPENIDRMVQLLQPRRACGARFIVVEQDLSFVEAIADDVLVLDHGETMVTGSLARIGREAIDAHLVV